MSDPLLKTLETVADKLDRVMATQHELADRVTGLEQKGGGPDEARVREMEAAQQKARSLSNDGYGIRKVYNRGESMHIVGSKARVADVLPKSSKAHGISLGRYVAAGLLGQKCGDRDALELVAETKSVSTGTSGLVIPVEYQGEWIDRLRANMVLVAAGAQTVPMPNKTHTGAALTADPTASWHTEAADITATDPTFAARTLTAQTVAVRCTASVEATQDSPNFGDQLADAMAAAIAVEIDRVGLVGSGTPPEPRGILNVSGINTVASGGTLTSYAKVLEAVQELLEANVALDVATKFAIMSPRTLGRFENLATGIASDLTQLPRPRSLEATQFLVTTAVPNNLSTDKLVLFMGDFRDLVLGVRTDTTIEALKLQTYASNLVVEFIAYSRVDFLAVRPASFVTLTGIA